MQPCSPTTHFLLVHDGSQAGHQKSLTGSHNLIKMNPARQGPPKSRPTKKTNQPHASLACPLAHEVFFF